MKTEWDSNLAWDEVQKSQKQNGRPPWYIRWFWPLHRVVDPSTNRLWYYYLRNGVVIGLHHKYGRAVTICGNMECITYDAGYGDSSL